MKWGQALLHQDQDRSAFERSPPEFGFPHLPRNASHSKCSSTRRAPNNGMRKAGHRAGVRTCLHFPAALLRLELFSGGFPRRWAAARRKWMRLYQRRQRRCRRIQRARDGSRLTKGSRQKKALPQRPAPPKSEVLRRKKAGQASRNKTSATTKGTAGKAKKKAARGRR